MFCIKCGKKILANDRYCQYCGEKIDGTEEPQNIKQTNLVQDEKSKKLKLSKNTWKPALIIIAVLGFFTWAYFANESDPNANQNLVNVGLYLCSEYHANKAESLFTNVDYTEDINRLEELWNEIENMYVDEYSEESINSYNAKVDQYSAQATLLEQRIIATEGSVEEHDSKIESYNNYLISNCDKR